MDNLILFIIIIGISIGLFLLFRKVTLWYFRINEIIELLDRQLNNQRDINRMLDNHFRRERKDEEDSIPEK